MLVSLIRNASTACLSLFFLLLAPWALAGDLWVDFIDVGQGDSALILSPSGKSVLVDGGPADAADEILEVMRARNIKRLDLIVISHAHADHIGGLEAIMGKVDVGLVLDPGFPHPTETYRRLLQHIEAKKIPLAIARKGRQIDLGEGSRMLLIAPKDPLLSGTRSDANSNSVVLRLEMGNVSVLLTGDAEAPTERRIMEYPDELAATILKVGHHGSRHSTTEAFLELVAPRVGIISCGRDNRYQHPHPELLSRLASQPMAVYRTDCTAPLPFAPMAKNGLSERSIMLHGPPPTIRARRPPGACSKPASLTLTMKTTPSSTSIRRPTKNSRVCQALARSRQKPLSCTVRNRVLLRPSTHYCMSEG
jgi:competence protein ComEC